MREVIVIGWLNVLAASVLVVMNIIISYSMKLKLESRLFISAVRCVVQLTILAFVLEPLFTYESLWLLVFLATFMSLFGAVEVTASKLRMSFRGSTLSIFCILFTVSLVVSSIGTGILMGIRPFYRTQHFVPTFGMLLGNASTAISLTLQSLTDQFYEDKDEIDMLLAFGATRYEAAIVPIRKAIYTGLIPTLNAMSLQGLVSIPGMTTGQILAGMDPLDAVKYQMIIMFLIGISATLCCLSSAFLFFFVIFDAKHILRVERLHKKRKFHWRSLFWRLLGSYNGV